MARPVVINWPAPDVSAICAAQTIGAAGNLLINGDGVNSQGFPPSVTLTAIARTISISSTGNLSGVNFTVTGTYRGAPHSETITGPNNDTVETTTLFESVTQVSVNSAVGTAVTVGTGTTGRTAWMNYNYQGNVIVEFGVQVVVTGTITYSFEATLDDVNLIPNPTTFEIIENMENPTTDSQIALQQGPINYFNITIQDSTDGSLVVTYIQQGIN